MINKIKDFLKPFIEVVKTMIDGFGTHGVMTFAAAIGFYTIFSLPGLLVTIIVVAGFFLGKDAASGQLTSQLGEFIGTDIAQSISDIIVQVEVGGDGTLQTIIGVGTLVFSATTVFMSLQEGLNRIWDVVAKPKRGIVKFLINRVLSLGMIVGMGFIFIVSLISDTILEIFFNQIQKLIGAETSFLLDIVSTGLSFAIIFLIIAMIFKFLPDVKLRWKDVGMAALITAGLFVLGKYAIQVYLSNSSFSETYQAAGSIVVLLIWVYYSTVVILLGAEITRAIMIYKGRPIRPANQAQKIEIKQVDYDTYKSQYYHTEESEE
ncbi:YihY/virulence factor BrkB family protein [Brumimicrobium aurantiacum]|uniref:YihY/virulence factor BrkB family protein n=1 Tax=Brumimicrobium aurantiacum TaxID=1737063 RepID=A0A3E1EWG2_9FLAO|nr:YihY/virulence factor BrkB family protein [Brumimicrobium aurantiacum]RFC53896.1 YihY/virulence factor BrkB family protein [Brumimicrobium aurantiacum]